MLRKLMYLPVVAVCAFGLMTAGAEAGKKKNLAIGIAVGVAATALAIAAAQSANAHRDRENYGYNHGVGPKENAVGACIHRADRRVRRHPNGRFARPGSCQEGQEAGRQAQKSPCWSPMCSLTGHVSAG